MLGYVNGGNRVSIAHFVELIMHCSGFKIRNFFFNRVAYSSVGLTSRKHPKSLTVLSGKVDMVPLFCTFQCLIQAVLSGSHLALHKHSLFFFFFY